MSPKEQRIFSKELEGCAQAAARPRAGAPHAILALMTKSSCRSHALQGVDTEVVFQIELKHLDLSRGKPDPWPRAGSDTCARAEAAGCVVLCSGGERKPCTWHR